MIYGNALTADGIMPRRELQERMRKMSDGEIRAIAMFALLPDTKQYKYSDVDAALDKFREVFGDPHNLIPSALFGVWMREPEAALTLALLIRNAWKAPQDDPVLDDFIEQSREDKVLPPKGDYCEERKDRCAADSKRARVKSALKLVKPHRAILAANGVPPKKPRKSSIRRGEAKRS